jgi:hypothetical protein
MRGATFGAAILIAASFAGIQSANAGSVSVASFSAGGEKLNRHRANGEVFNPGALTAADVAAPWLACAGDQRARRQLDCGAYQ